MRALVLWAMIAGAPPVTVEVRPAGVPGLACALRGVPPAAAALRLTAAGPSGGSGRWQWRPAPGDVLACTAPGFEPVDLEAAQAAPFPAVVVELLPARPVTLVPAGPAPQASIEWRALEAGGTSLRARRSLPVGGPVTLHLARRDRVLRVTLPGASPVSFFLPAGVETATLEMPAPQAGGEVWGVLPAHRYRPESLDLLSGPHRRLLRPDARGVFQASGLAPGKYTLTPAYRGGHRGRALGVVVRAGQTTEPAPVAREPGAVRVSLAAPLCGERELALDLAPEGGGPASRRPLPDSACDVEVEGLEEGSWTVAAIQGGARNEERARAAFVATPGASAAVTLEPVVRVSGRVTFGGRPASRLRVAFARGPRQWSAETDGDGAYALVLGDPGEYGVSLRASAELPSRALMRTLRAGDQHEDFELGEGTVAVRVRASGEDLAEVQVALLAKHGPRLAGVLRPQHEDAARFVGLDYGEYRVTAATAGGLTSRAPAEVVLSPATPEAEVVLVLGRHRGRLTLTDPRGQPIGGARAQAGLVPLREQATGVFAIDSVPVGERLTVNAPGYTPLCHVLQAGDLPELRLTPPAVEGTLTLRFAADLAWQGATLQGLPGSDCAVALEEVESQIRLEPQGATMVLQLPRGAFEVSLGGRTEPVAVPGPEVTIGR